MNLTPLSLDWPTRAFELPIREILRNDLDRKACLGLDALTMWLHDYIATHLRPPAAKVGDLRTWCGSGESLGHFRHRLRGSLSRLEVGPNPLVTAWSIDQFDRVQIEKSATRVAILPVHVTPANARVATDHRGEVARSRQRRAKVAL